MEKQQINISLLTNRPVLKAIFERRDQKTFSSTPIEKATVETLLTAATWAPNHKLTEPWRFTVIFPNKRDEFINIYTQGLIRLANDNKELEKAQLKAEKIKHDFSQIPLFIAAAYQTNPDATLSTENLITASCGLQNMLLAAEEFGIGAHWGSGKATKTKIVQEYFGFKKDQAFLGLFQMGYTRTKGRMKRSPLKHFVTYK